MKTRIISGAVMILLLAGIVYLGFFWQSAIITAAVAILAVLAVFELLFYAAKIKDVLSLVGACLVAFFIPAQSYITNSFSDAFILIFAAAVVYCIFAAIMTVMNHGKFRLSQIVSLYGLPIIYGCAFFCLEGIINNRNGIYYLLLLLNFSSVCDMGAYFVGVACGKHKLCPKVSPKKTVEGAIGGIVSSLIVTVILCICYDKTMWIMLLITVGFCILSMFGDLFASSIKRAVGIKDFSNLIPGHGGIMDRLDSIIMIAPAMYLLALFSVI